MIKLLFTSVKFADAFEAATEDYDAAVRSHLVNHSKRWKVQVRYDLPSESAADQAMLRQVDMVLAGMLETADKRRTKAIGRLRGQIADGLGGSTVETPAGPVTVFETPEGGASVTGTPEAVGYVQDAVEKVTQTVEDDDDEDERCELPTDEITDAEVEFVESMQAMGAAEAQQAMQDDFLQSLEAARDFEPDEDEDEDEAQAPQEPAQEPAEAPEVSQAVEPAQPLQEAPSAPLTEAQAVAKSQAQAKAHPPSDDPGESCVVELPKPQEKAGFLLAQLLKKVEGE